jgi:Spy/CpxP family protein refolding chaperone
MRQAMRVTLLAVLFLAVLACAVPAALAQHPGGGPPGGPPGGGGGQNPFGGPSAGQPGGPAGVPGNGGNLNNGPPPGSPNAANATTSTLRGGLQLGPPGRWWDDAAFANSLGLDKNQRHRMDDVFKANKGDLFRLYKALEHEEHQLEKVTRGKNLNEAQIDAQIDRVVVARGELEKANAHMLLEIRREMTPEQTEKLEQHRPALAPSEN